jgi:hypothetical protein
VLINEDSYVEGPESLALLLSNLKRWGGLCFTINGDADYYRRRSDGPGHKP